MTSIHHAIGADMQHIGGLLRCLQCGGERPLGDVGDRLRDGWPMCCGYTMHWITQRQLDGVQPCTGLLSL
jgi:hypothetical protein